MNRETIAASQLATSTSTGSITQAQAAAASSSSSVSSSATVTHGSSSSSSSTSSSSVLTLTQPSRIDASEDAATLKGITNAGGGAIATGSNRQTLLKTDILQSVGNGPATSAMDVTTMGVSGAAGGAPHGVGVGVVGTNSILTVDEDSLSLDRLNSLRIYMTSIKTLPFNLRIYG